MSKKSADERENGHWTDLHLCACDQEQLWISGDTGHTRWVGVLMSVHGSDREVKECIQRQSGEVQWLYYRRPIQGRPSQQSDGKDNVRWRKTGGMSQHSPQNCQACPCRRCLATYKSWFFFMLRGAQQPARRPVPDLPAPLPRATQRVRSQPAALAWPPKPPPGLPQRG